MHGHLGGRPPAVDLAAEQRLARLLQDLVGVATSAHDLSDGGLAQALAEASIVSGTGATVRLDGDAFVGLFAESAARAIVTVPAGAVEEPPRAGEPPRRAARRDRYDGRRGPRRRGRLRGAPGGACGPPGPPPCRRRWAAEPQPSLDDGLVGQRQGVAARAAAPDAAQRQARRSGPSAACPGTSRARRR
ncbi:AIR synthase-related protein [Nocardioides convexus]|uniref:AIR synthase-related protein n=1 Tax=Nocardioides convexus TaxID=2712224 RepID=UPI00241898B6|nr:AIR synthase-related protein [Nocardioides convexus]